MAILPRQTLKLYAVPEEKRTAKITALTEIWGINLLAGAAVWLLASRMESFSKAVSYANLITAALLTRYAYSGGELEWQDRSQVLLWATVLTGCAYLGLNDCFGMMDGGVLVQALAMLVVTHALIGIVSPQITSELYGALPSLIPPTPPPRPPLPFAQTNARIHV
jgi:hypothetical protein